MKKSISVALATSAVNNRLTFSNFKLNIMIRDCQENKSELIEFPLNFAYEAPQKLPAEWEDVANNSLGAIMIDLENILTPAGRSGR